jgi:hypothetical protein
MEQVEEPLLVEYRPPAGDDPEENGVDQHYRYRW